MGSDLALRVASAAALAPLAIGSAWLGGSLFLLFWLLAALGVWWEWTALVRAESGKAPRVAVAGAVVLVLSAASLAAGSFPVALAILAAGALGAAALAHPGRRLRAAAGVLYAGVLALGPALLRGDAAVGLAAILLLFAVVWTTDVAAYFAGRLLGGPRLWPRVSPKKTWSGALVGTAAGIGAGLAAAAAFALPRLAAVALACLVLSAASQAGDLFESALKRRFDVKDSGTIIPGHGGLMDRLDGFVAATVLAAAIGLARGGVLAPSRGFLIW